MMTLLILAVIVLGILAVTRLSRVYELTSALRGKREEEITERDSKMNARLMWAFPFAYFGFFLWLTVAYQKQMLPVSASEHGVWLDDLMNFDISIAKSFFLPWEGRRMQFRAEAFNALNSVSFMNPALDANTPSNFGQFKGALAPRVIQFALRFEF